MTIDPAIEDMLTKAIQHTDRESYLSIDPNNAQKIISNIEKKSKKFESTQSIPVLLCSPAVRMNLKKLTERFMPQLVVLSHSEIDPNLNIKNIGMVTLNNAT
jgi:flagellar biosynthesis protein FlhA